MARPTSEPHTYTLEDNAVIIRVEVTFKQHLAACSQRSLLRDTYAGVVGAFADWIARNTELMRLSDG